MAIKVKNIEGKAFTIDVVTSDTTIEVLKAKIQDKDKIEHLDASSREQSASILNVLQGMQAAQNKTDQQQCEIMDMLQRMAPTDRPSKASREM